MRLVNLTPHAVNIVDTDGNEILTIASQGLARCKTETITIGTIDVDTPNGTITIPETSTKFGEVVGLPEPEDNTLYIVSRVIVDATGRNDLRIPNETVRDHDGRICGCLSIGRI